MSEHRAPMDDAELGTQLRRRASSRLRADERDHLVRAVLNASATTRQQPQARWAWPRATLGFAGAAAVIALIVVVSSLGPLTPGPGQGTAAPSGSAPRPGTSATTGDPNVLTVSELLGLIADGKSHDVVVDADLDIKGLRDLGRFGPACAEGLLCPLALVSGTDERVDVVVGSDVQESVPADRDVVPGPLALRVRGPFLELLGLVARSASGDVTRPARASAIADARSLPPGSAVVVRGFLQAMVLRCPPAPDPIDDPDSPFASCNGTYLLDVPSPSQGSLPADGITVQPSARDFAPQPASSGGLFPIDAAYLLRLVSSPDGRCTNCAGWKVAGRLDARSGPVEPTATPTPVRLMGIDDFRTLLANSARFDGRVLLSDVALEPLTRRNPLTCDPCAIGQIVDSEGIYHDVTATAALISAMPASIPTWDGPKAFRTVSGGSLQLLGMLYVDGPTGLVLPATGGAVNGALNGLLSRVIVVHGWLTGTAFPCGGPNLADPTPPPDSAFDPCGHTYLTAAPFNTSLGTPVGIAVQSSAYDTYAPTATGAGLTDEADYLLGMEQDPRPNCSPCFAWRVIARVDPQPLSTAEPTATPSPGSLPARILTPDELLHEISESRIRDRGPVDVVADVDMDQDFSLGYPPCFDGAACVGPSWVIHRPLSIGVYPRPDDQYTDLTATEVRGPLALRIGRNGSVTFLGPVDVHDDVTLTWSVQSAADRETRLGRVLAVRGWLSSFGGSCGPVVPPDYSTDPPFNCGVADVLAPADGEPIGLVIGSTGSTGLAVQRGAYSEFAPEPDGAQPRDGIYLIRWVADPNHADRTASLMIGRLSP